MKIAVIGGVAAGMSAAAKARRSAPDAQIVVYEKGEDISYGACGLPYYVSGKNNDAEKLRIRTLQEFAALGIEVHTRHAVEEVDAAAKTLRGRRADGTAFAGGWDRLMIATGAEAILPKLPGAHLPGVYVLNTMQDGLALRAAVEGVQKVAVVGGGFIGIEVAESLHEAGKEVRVIEAAADILAPFDAEITGLLRAHMVQCGMALLLNEPVHTVLEKDGVAAGVQTANGSYAADIVVMALGVRPATAFLRGTGMALAKNGAIEVDRAQRTSLADIWAAGDCAMVYNRIEQRNVYQPLGTVANKCGRIAGENLAGGSRLFDGCLGSAAVKVGHMEAARTGMSEGTARALCGEIATVFIESNDRPGYYPGQTPLWVKLVCEKGTKRILGGQAAGQKGAVLRVDAIAAAITGGLTAPELGMADFCYAPPFSEAWDALNIAGNAVK